MAKFAEPWVPWRPPNMSEAPWRPAEAKRGDALWLPGSRRFAAAARPARAAAEREASALDAMDTPIVLACRVLPVCVACASLLAAPYETLALVLAVLVGFALAPFVIE